MADRLSNGSRPARHTPAMIDPVTKKAVRRAPGRYGRAPSPGRPGRRVVITLSALVVTVGTVAAVLAYRHFGVVDVRGALSGYQLIDDQTVSVTFGVTRADPSRPVVCIVRARAVDGSEVGRREVLVGPATANTVQVTATVKTSKPPVIGDIYGCGVEVPGYLRSP